VFPDDSSLRREFFFSIPVPVANWRARGIYVSALAVCDLLTFSRPSAGVVALLDYIPGSDLFKKKNGCRCTWAALDFSFFGEPRGK
jgi:hypothetical protein